MCSNCLPALVAAPTPKRKSPRATKSNFTDTSVSSSTDESRNNTESHLSSDDIIAGSQTVAAPPSFEQPGSQRPESQQFLSQESRDPNTQKVLQENRKKPGPKSAKRQRDIETASESNWRERFEKRVKTAGGSQNTSGAMSRSRSPINPSTADPGTTSPITQPSPQPERSFVVRNRTQPSSASSQSVTNNTMPPPPPQRPPSQSTDDANGHSNLAAPRRIFTSTVPPANPGPIGSFNARNSGKLPGG